MGEIRNAKITGAMLGREDHDIMTFMYDLGYPNNNCIGCVKGGMGYWNKIRVDFPEVFKKRAELEREIGHSCLNGVFLDELEPDRGNMNLEVFPDCSIMCYLAESDNEDK